MPPSKEHGNSTEENLKIGNNLVGKIGNRMEKGTHRAKQYKSRYRLN